MEEHDLKKKIEQDVVHQVSCLEDKKAEEGFIIVTYTLQHGEILSLHIFGDWGSEHRVSHDIAPPGAGGGVKGLT